MPTPYQHRAWAQIRAVILHRDGHTCQIKGPGCTHAAHHVDHINPWQQGGDWFTHSNLRAACMHCNCARPNRRRRGELENAGPSRNW